MTNIIETMTLAAAKAVDSASLQAARAAVGVGTYPVDFLVHITGSFKVGEDYEQRLVAKVDFAALFAVAMSKLNGVTIDALVREALEADPGEIKEIKARASEALETIKAPTMSFCKGKVTTKLDFEIMEERQVIGRSPQIMEEQA